MQNVSNPYDRRCACSPGFGDSGCQQPVYSLARGQAQAVVLPPSAWVYFSVTLPSLPADSVTRPVLLVEMTRSTGPSTSGDPVLVVKPAGQTLPWYTDVPSYGDMVSYKLMQVGGHVCRHQPRMQQV